MRSHAAARPRLLGALPRRRRARRAIAGCTRRWPEASSVDYLEYSLRYGIWYEVNAYPHPDGLSIYFRDVTERVAAEQKLRLHERAIEASVNAIVITDRAAPAVLDRAREPRIRAHHRLHRG